MLQIQLKEQARESESDRRKLERARQEVFHHMTRMKCEKENLEREVYFKCFNIMFYVFLQNYFLQNDQLKEALEAERKGIGRYINEIQRKELRSNFEYAEKKVSNYMFANNLPKKVIYDVG